MDERDAADFRVAIRAMDRVYIEYMATPEEQRQAPNARTMSAGLFDALFG